jgi:hypothetical protein
MRRGGGGVGELRGHVSSVGAWGCARSRT